MTLNLAAVLRRKAYADFVAVEHLTLAQRQLYVKAIALYERALASLGPRRQQHGEQRMKRDQIWSIVQVELAGAYTAFAQQLQAGGRLSRDEGTAAAAASAEGSELQEPAAGGSEPEPAVSTAAALTAAQQAAVDNLQVDEADGTIVGAKVGTKGSAGTYIVDEDVVPDLLRKALEIYTTHQQPAKLCAVHAALGRYYLDSIESTIATGDAAANAKRLRGKADRALSHRNYTSSPHHSSIPGKKMVLRDCLRCSRACPRRRVVGPRRGGGWWAGVLRPSDRAVPAAPTAAILRLGQR